MHSYIGLSKNDANKLASTNGLEIRFILYRSFRGVDDSDSCIVIRQKLLVGDILELVISEFKTKL